MSGFAGVFQLDGAPVDRTWLETMANFLSFRGPDGTEVWTSGSAGLCHTLLRTRAETDNRPQIASLDETFFLAGDVRIDDRETLIAKFSDQSPQLKAASSAELILHAYAKWGEASVEHLLGDFSFVIWDARRKRVFAARDQLGVRPLFYAQVGQCLLISNTLDCIRQIKIVPDELDEHTVGDFLIFGENKNPAATFFSAIRRLPVANRLSAGASGLTTEKYWTLPIDAPVYYKRAGDYVDRFHELLRAAVRDRLPDGPLGILMSGGLDSPAVAATAVQLGAATSAFTSVYDRLIPDEERYYAGLVADHLRIPIHYNVRDDEPWAWDGEPNVIQTPEPLSDPTSLSASRSYHHEISGQARVFFLGDGPDAALFNDWKPYLRWLARERKLGRLCQALLLDFAASPRIPVLHTIPRRWHERAKNQPDWYEASFPQWLNPEFEARLGLRERWQKLGKWLPSKHPIREIGYANFACDLPMGGADGWDAGFTNVRADFLHPLWDLRMVRFLLSVPAMPWCRNKHLIRVALRGYVPEAVRKRPKSPLPGLPYLIRARAVEPPNLPPVAILDGYINTDQLPKWPGRNREELDLRLRVLGLHYWLFSL